MFYELAIQYYFHKTEIWAYVAPHALLSPNTNMRARHRHPTTISASSRLAPLLMAQWIRSAHTHIELLFHE